MRARHAQACGVVETVRALWASVAVAVGLGQLDPHALRARAALATGPVRVAAMCVLATADDRMAPSCLSGRFCQAAWTSHKRTDLPRRDETVELANLASACRTTTLLVKAHQTCTRILRESPAAASLRAYFRPSWTAFQVDRGRGFSVIVDGVSD
jgi:hypothetical protein